ncbi:forkhead box protein [Dongia deserti]|uniref:hypothetical protein n=1 Tax=Dongia deserti TaxID=2268030 RepID=UPI000E652B3E|nr:hypothetical protein [Dongia deserti]
MEEWGRYCVLAILEWLTGVLVGWNSERHLKQRLRKMLRDPKFPKGFRSTGQLMHGIASDKQKTVRLLFAIGARRSEISDEWTLK